MNLARRNRIINAIVGELREIVAELENVRDEESDAFSNMPESLQDSERGQKAREAVDTLETAVDSITSETDNLENIVSE